MSDLRGEIRQQVNRAGSFERPEWHYVDSDEVTDAILALIVDALTSDAAIDAMLQRQYGWADYDHGDTYLDLSEAEKVDARDDGRHEILGALEAAGIVKGDNVAVDEERGAMSRMRLPKGTSVIVHNDATYEIVPDDRGLLDFSRVRDEGYHKIIEGWEWTRTQSDTWFEPGMIRCDEPGDHRVLIARLARENG
jgi:hypothetical protein